MSLRCRSLEEAEVVLQSQEEHLAELGRKVRHIEKQLDTRGSRWWKRVWFRLNGWPPWWIVAQRPAWRPWHRWTGV